MNEQTAKEKLNQIRDEVMCKQPALADSLAFVGLYQAAQALFAQERYDLVVDICFALEKEQMRRFQSF